jgi:hypothetical protein
VQPWEQVWQLKKNLIQVKKVLTPLICSRKLYVYERIVHDMRTFFLCEYHNKHYVTSCSCCLTPVLTTCSAPSCVLLAAYKDNGTTPCTTPLFIIRMSTLQNLNVNNICLNREFSRHQARAQCSCTELC